ncbi:Protein CBG00506 [Caenorhabditis briggsae]|uniref:Protein CBG00506 n=1 Tax=Caenorhabditis briggsae TaxID=6238 RepID=A8WNR2_CAEBR|nr:Protein CBG00506 [Caenorhabditis briggsae]CAP22117.2 Protein CBG00506 [Caenorhabditis briggsae]
MLSPTLFQLADKSAAQNIHYEKIPLEFILDSKASNEVVRQLLKLDPKNIKKLETCKKQLSRLTELDLKKCKIDVEGILNLKNFKLNSLNFGYLYHLKTEFPDPSNSSGIDIVSLLKRAVNTQEMMIHLGFSGEEDKRTFFHQRKLSNLCSSFPNLRILDISFARGLTTMEGIKNLKHLQKLVMRGIELEDIYGYKELSDLKNLRVLDVSDCDDDSYRVIRSLLTSDVRMKNLVFLDCSMTWVKDYELKEFVKQNRRSEMANLPLLVTRKRTVMLHIKGQRITMPSTDVKVYGFYRDSTQTEVLVDMELLKHLSETLLPTLNVAKSCPLLHLQDDSTISNSRDL